MKPLKRKRELEIIKEAIFLTGESDIKSLLVMIENSLRIRVEKKNDSKKKHTRLCPIEFDFSEFDKLVESIKKQEDKRQQKIKVKESITDWFNDKSMNIGDENINDLVAKIVI